MSQAVPPVLDGLDYIQPLGSGGYADVYLYEQQMPRMKVAVKVLKSEGLTVGIKQQFIDEANTMAQLADHPYIVQVFRAGTSEDGRPFLVMKYYPPPNLAQRARRERFSVEEVLRTGIQLASAVETAHRAGVIHRDIKPANVLVSQYGSPGLTDFGIAGIGGALEDLDDDIGVSVPWAPPEVLYGQSNGDARADVYALAATLWQLLVGRSPFEVPGGDNSAYALMPRIRSNPPPETERADVPALLERLLAQAMSKNPLARPATALELARSLQHIEQQERFSRTAIVVLDEEGHTASRPAAQTPDPTRLRHATPAPGSGRTLPPPPLGQPVIGGELSGGRGIPGSPAVSFTTGAQGPASSTVTGPQPGYQSGPSGARPDHASGPSPFAPVASGPRPATTGGSRPGQTSGRHGSGGPAPPPPASRPPPRAPPPPPPAGGGIHPPTPGGAPPGPASTPHPRGALSGTPLLPADAHARGDKVTIDMTMDGAQEGDTFQVKAVQTESQDPQPSEFESSVEVSAPSTEVGKATFPTNASPGTRVCAIARVARGEQTTQWSAPECVDVK
ncbi:serine/threonine-protein kinase [Janibacter melonis]|uniref:serine/threonine-protein kinase n=1 Tax=Janibacter melonis TaxID=262209 RepID=UPI0020952EEC|nr:serine/threonine-protein kinase [Janibacter melonis]